ncbi:MAG: type II toxin-antitoxin system VapC family toxin [Chloroflexota bacterium]|nr:type II toxin-antitoxin system VapC family toxin [Chloroflexota bacterium]
MARSVYLDASAGVKLVLDEPESAALVSWLSRWPARSSSSLFRTEVVRATRRALPKRLSRARGLVTRVSLIAIDDQILDEAARIDPLSLRSLDAIHLATALRLADELEALVTYDRRMIEGAHALGLPVASPA